MPTKSNGYNGSGGYIPDGQTSRGTEQVTSVNPKDASARRRDGVVPNEGDSGQSQMGQQVGRTARHTSYGGNEYAHRGSEASVPSPDAVNTNYALTGGQVPTPTNVSAYRSYDVDPYEIPSPNGDTHEMPRIPQSKPGQGDQS